MDRLPLLSFSSELSALVSPQGSSLLRGGRDFSVGIHPFKYLITQIKPTSFTPKAPLLLHSLNGYLPALTLTFAIMLFVKQCHRAPFLMGWRDFFFSL